MFRQINKIKRFFSNYDLCIVGGGPAGYVSAIKASQLGLKTICVEKRGELGGTCLNVGCIPSKTLLNITHKYHEIHDMKKLGLNIEDKGYDWNKILKNKEDVIKGLNKGIEGLFMKNKVVYKKGYGKFLSKEELELNLNNGEKEVIKAKNYLICTGSEPSSLPGLEIDEKIIITSNGALSLDKVPNEMIIIGGGVIGLELGSVYARLGTKIKVIEYMDNICPGLDTEIIKLFTKELKKLKFDFKFARKVTSGKVKDGKAEIIVENIKTNEKETYLSDVCLVSTGRKPHTSNLGLENTTINLDKSGRIEVNDRFKTSENNIYAVGDVINGPMLAHKAEEEGIACVEYLNGLDTHVNYNAIPGVIYTYPEIANVGKTEDELIKEKIEYNKGKFPFAANSRARANLENSNGFVKVLTCKKTDRILGAHIIGPNAGDLIQEFVLGIEYGATSEDIGRTCHAHPTLSEALKEASLSAHSKPIHS